MNSRVSVIWFSRRNISNGTESVLYRSSFKTKIQLVHKYDERDPYLTKMNEISEELKDLSTIEVAEAINNLVLQTSYIKQQMKAYKSLKAHNFYLSGGGPRTSVTNGSMMTVIWSLPGWVFVLILFLFFYVKVLAVAADVNKHATPNNT